MDLIKYVEFKCTLKHLHSFHQSVKIDTNGVIALFASSVLRIMENYLFSMWLWKFSGDYNARFYKFSFGFYITLINIDHTNPVARNILRLSVLINKRIKYILTTILFHTYITNWIHEVGIFILVLIFQMISNNAKSWQTIFQWIK